MSQLHRVQAFVMGRVGADLYPLQLNTPLEEVHTFERFVGGFAGNVVTGLARLGVHAAIVSAVGDDGHGRYVRNFLDAEGVDTTWLGTHPTLRTALAFCEAWPPDHFPITFYRTPTCPDWEIRPEDLPLDAIAAAPLFYVTGTGLAREPSRATTLAALQARYARRQEPPSGDGVRRRATTVVDLDWRPMLWEDASAYGPVIREAAAMADTLIGGAGEFEAAGLDPTDALRLGPRLAVVKRGAAGARVIGSGVTREIPGLPVPVTNGLGAGDAFAAAYGAAVLAGLDAPEAARRGNAAGAIVATRLSCSAAMPRPEEVEALLAGGTIVDGRVVAVPATRSAGPAR
ncbi:MAG: PfkB family carbohydrate kinase [Chloroflexota bacterium]|nr:PfkB family carbohydrate kinase [Chloroflexota bacterium]